MLPSWYLQNQEHSNRAFVFSWKSTMSFQFCPKWSPNELESSETTQVLSRNTKQHRSARRKSQMSRSVISTFRNFNFLNFASWKFFTANVLEIDEILSIYLQIFFSSKFKVSSNGKTERDVPEKGNHFLSHYPAPDSSLCGGLAQTCLTDTWVN